MKTTGKISTLKRLSIFLGCTVAMAFTGCMDDDFDQVPEQTPLSYVTLFHGAPEAQNLDIYVDNNKLNTQAFKYADYSDYLNFQTTTSRKIKFTPFNASNALIDTTVIFKENKFYSLFAVGRQQNLRLLMVEDSLKVPSSGKANIRVINISPDVPSVDIATTGTNGSTLFTAVDYRENTLFKEVTAGSNMTFEVKQAGGSTVLLTVPDLNLQAGRIYTLVLRGLKTPPTGNTNTLSLQVIRNY